MHGVADLVSGQGRTLGRLLGSGAILVRLLHASGANRPEPRDALGEVAVRAALEECDRAVRQLADVVQRRGLGSPSGDRVTPTGAGPSGSSPNSSS